MGDNSISIVPKLSSYPDRINKANEVLNWLVTRDIIKPTPTDCILGSDNGYAVSAGAKNVVTYPDQLPFRCQTNGLDIIISRTIFHTMGAIDELICPSCHFDIAAEDWEMFDEWYSGRSDGLTCPKCRINSDLYKYNFTPKWGFSDLGFTFWNWGEFTQRFIDEFKQKLDCDILVVYDHI